MVVNTIYLREMQISVCSPYILTESSLEKTNIGIYNILQKDESLSSSCLGILYRDQVLTLFCLDRGP